MMDTILKNIKFIIRPLDGGIHHLTQTNWPVKRLAWSLEAARQRPTDTDIFIDPWGTNLLQISPS